MRWAISILAVTIAGCSSPTTPTADHSDFSGIWQGEYRVRSCLGGRTCTLFQGQTLRFLLRLSQAGTNVVGVLTLGDTVASGVNLDAVNVNVTGTISPTGALTLTGSRPAASPTDANGELQVTKFAVQRDVQRGLTGTLEYNARYSLEQNHETTSVSWTGDVTTARRVADAGTHPGSFAGRWAGNYVVRQCVPVGWTICLPEMANHVYAFDLRLTQSGSMLTGTMRWSFPAPDNQLPVTGRVSADSLVVEGSASGVQSGVDADVLRLGQWTTTRDDLGRMFGSFQFVRETHWSLLPPRPEAGAVWSITYDAQLVDVVLQPQ